MKVIPETRHARFISHDIPVSLINKTTTVKYCRSLNAKKRINLCMHYCFSISGRKHMTEINE